MSLVYILREATERLPDSNGVASNFFKIGKGQGAIEDRIAALQTGNPRPIEAVRVFQTPDSATAFYLETILHNQNAEHRIPGSEWFRFDGPGLQGLIDAAAVHQRQLEGLVADESRFTAVTVTSDERAPDADELARFASVKSSVLEPRAQEKRQRAALDIQRKLFAFRKVLIGTPSLSEIKLQDGQRRFDITAFRLQHPELAKRFMREGKRSFRWSFRAAAAEKRDDALIESASSSVKEVLQGGDATSHRALADQIHEALRGFDERDIMAQLRALTMSEAHRKVPERLERAWFACRVGAAAGLTGICTCTISAPSIDSEALREHLVIHDPAMLEGFMRTGPQSIRVASPDGGVELETGSSNNDE